MWDFLIRGHDVTEVGCSNPGRGTILGGVFHQAWKLAMFSIPNMPYIVIFLIYLISLRGEAINYRPYASPSFEVASHVKNLPFRLIFGYY